MTDQHDLQTPTPAPAPPAPIMDKETGRRCLLEVAAVCKRNGLTPILLQGTALGAYRDKGFVPMERDIDFGFLYEDFHGRLHDIAADLLRLRYFVELIKTPFTRPYSLNVELPIPVRPGIRDMVRFDMCAQFSSRGYRYGVSRHPITEDCPEYSIVHPAHFFEDAQPIELFGEEFLAPHPIEEYLEREYGDWRTPRDDHVSRTRRYNFREICGIHNQWLEPGMLSLELSTEKLDQNTTEDYYWYLRSPPFRKTFLEPMAEQLNQLNLPVLDVGCGEAVIADMLTVPYRGVDKSPLMIERCRAERTRGEFLVGDFADYFEAGEFYAAGVIYFGGIFDVMIKPHEHLRFAELYLQRFGARYLAIYDLQRLDSSVFDKAFKRIYSHEAVVEMRLDPKVKKHRKLLIYDTQGAV